MERYRVYAKRSSHDVVYFDIEAVSVEDAYVSSKYFESLCFSRHISHHFLYPFLYLA